MKKLLGYVKNHTASVIFLFLWSSVLFWATKERIIDLIQPGKGFAGRSLPTQAVLFFLFSFLFFIVLSFLYFLFNRYIRCTLASRVIPAKFHERVLSIVNVVFHPIFQLTLILWAVALTYIPRGFDITDNGYYLIISHRFEDVAYEIREFGLFTRLIYQAAGESAAVMRVFGALLFLGVSLFCGWSIGRVYGAKDYRKMVLFLAIPSVPAVMFYRQWLSTPNYNWLALISGLILLTGFMFISSVGKRQRFFGGVVIGIGGFVALFAKPTTAAFFLGISLFVVLVEQIKFKDLLNVFWGGVAGLLGGVVFIYLNCQSIPGFYTKIVRGYEAISLFEHSVGSIFQPLWDYLNSLFIGYWWLWIGFAASLVVIKLVCEYAIRTTRDKADRVVILFWLASLVLAGLFVDSGLWAGMIYGFTLLLVEIDRRILPGSPIEKKRHWLSILRSLYGILIAFAIAFGTINPYVWVFANIVCVFALSLLFLIDCLPENTHSKALMGLAILFLIVVPYTVFIKPLQRWSPMTYGQDVEVWKMETNVPIRLGKETVITSPRYGLAFTTLQNDALANGFMEGTPVIDLTGMAPGLIYVLDGRSPVYPWYSGGYPNSTRFVRNILKDWTDVDFKKAWVLTSENRRKIPSTLIDERGGKFPGGFQKVSSVIIPTKDNIVVELWKPSGN